MPRFTKKPVTIDAILCGEVLDGASSGRFSANAIDQMPPWVIGAFASGVIGFELDAVLINTKEGQMRGERTDWLIRGVKGELYPCKPDIFAMTYEPEGFVTLKMNDISDEDFDKLQKAMKSESSIGRAVILDAEPNGDLLDSAWGIIANAGGGNWDLEKPEWKAAAERWREEYHKTFPSHGAEAAAMIAKLPSDTFRAGYDVEANRDELQKKMLAWSIECFGKEEATSIAQRALRLLEEAIELAQAAGVPGTMVEQLGSYVYARPPGTLSQEVGGVSVTLLVLCAAAGLSADQEERREIERVLSKPPLHFAARNANKNEAGFKITHVALTERGLELGGTRPIKEKP